MLGITAGLILVIVTAVTVYVLAFTPRQRPPLVVHVPATPENLERGRYLVVNVLQCIDCHSERDWALYGGPPKEPIGAGRACMTRKTHTAGVNVGEEFFPGVLCIRNITPDADTGIGAWSDGEIMRAVREGVSRDGTALFPIMPYHIFNAVADQDMAAIVAYLRTLPPVKSSRPQKEIDFPMNLLFRAWPRPLPGPVAMPDQADRITYGAYLARVARCEFCHSPREPRAREPIPGKQYSGGVEFFLGGRKLVSKNLTSHDSGLGAWTREAFIARFKAFREPVPVAPEQNTLMNWNAFAGMTEDDLGAIYDYLRTLRPLPTGGQGR